MITSEIAEGLAVSFAEYRVAEIEFANNPSFQTARAVRVWIGCLRDRQRETGIYLRTEEMLDRDRAAASREKFPKDETAE